MQSNDPSCLAGKTMGYFKQNLKWLIWFVCGLALVLFTRQIEKSQS